MRYSISCQNKTVWLSRELLLQRAWERVRLFHALHPAKTIIGWGFCDIGNNQGRGKCYQPKRKAEADNTNRNLDYSGYQKNESNNCFIIHCFEENNDKRIIAYFAVRELDIALRNHALRAQPRATLKPGNRKEKCGTGIRNPESGIWKPQITENKFFKLAKIILHSVCR